MKMGESIEQIIERWMREGYSREDARRIALEEIDFYWREENGDVWKGPNDSLPYSVSM